MVSSFKKRKVAYYNAEDPHTILSLSEERYKQIKETLPFLMSLYGSSGAKPSVRFYEGRPAMKRILMEMLDEGVELIAFSSTNDLNEAMGNDIIRTMGNDFNDYIKERVRRKITSRVIMRDTDLARWRQKIGPKELRAVRLIPASWEHHSLVVIGKHRIFMFSLLRDFNTLVVESEQFVQFHRTLFEYVWQTLPKPPRF